MKPRGDVGESSPTVVSLEKRLLEKGGERGFAKERAPIPGKRKEASACISQKKEKEREGKCVKLRASEGEHVKESRPDAGEGEEGELSRAHRKKHSFNQRGQREKENFEFQLTRGMNEGGGGNS